MDTVSFTYHETPADIADVLSGPHEKSLVDVGEAAPVVIHTPLRFLTVKQAAWERKGTLSNSNHAGSYA